MMDSVDVLVLCALRDEFDAFRELGDFGIPAHKLRKDVRFGREILRFELPSIDPVASDNEHPYFEVVVAMCEEGLVKAGVNAMQLINAFSPGCVALCGLCAGDKNRVRKGDVVFAQAVWSTGAGKTTVHSSGEIETREFKADIQVWPVYPDWSNSAQEYVPQFLATYKHQLMRRFPDKESLSMTYGDDRHSYEVSVHLGDLLSVPDVTVDPDVFVEAQKHKRHTLALDMEAMAVVHAANRANVPWLVVKSVQDFAQSESAADGQSVPKNDLFRAFAACSAKTFLLAFCQRCVAKVVLPRLPSLSLQVVTGPPAVDLVLPSPILGQVGIERCLGLLRRKLTLDFSLAAINRKQILEETRRGSLENLEKAKILPNARDPRIGSVDIDVPATVWLGRIPDATLKRISTLPKLRVSCSAIYPAAIAVWKSLQRRHGIDLSIDVEMINSIDLVMLLNKGEDYDFVVAAEDPFFLIGDSGAQKYHRLFPIHRAPQWVFQRKNQPSRQARIIYIVPGSSGAVQWKTGKGLVVRPDFKEIEALDIYRMAMNLEFGEQIPVWEPIAGRLSREPELERVDDSDYNIYVSLYSQRETWEGSQAKENARGAVIEAFIAEWNWCMRNIDASCGLLTEDQEFLELFLIGSGI